MAGTTHFEVILRRSGAGRTDRQRRTLLGLGLKRIGKSVRLKDTPAIRGMLYKVVHLVDVTVQQGEVPPVSARLRAAAATAAK